jgi:hypothetical protein
MNNILFRPHGLLCLIMTYKLDPRSSTVGVDMLKSGSSGATNGELELPEAAALVFPEDEYEAGDRRKGLGSFTADYFDKGSQAKYVGLPASARYGTSC